MDSKGYHLQRMTEKKSPIDSSSLNDQTRDLLDIIVKKR